MARPTCSSCSGVLPLRARADARFCSTRCRVAAHRKRGIPSELRRQSRWVRYSRKKVPLTIHGEPASSTNPNTWSTHREAVESTAGVGMGFVLNGDGIVCLDLDGCITSDGEVAAAARRLLDLAGATYVEVSPSGLGLHIWGRASLPAGRKLQFQGQPVEAYPSGRYITITGRPFEAAPSKLADISGSVAAVLA